MVDISSFRESPLKVLSDAMVAVSSKAVTMAEVPFPGQVNLRGDVSDKTFAGAVAKVLGFALPSAANTFTQKGDLAAIWLGPDEWLLLCAGGAQGKLVTDLESALGNVHHSVVDVSDNRVCLKLSGDKAREVLAKGCGLDLHPSVFKSGNCAQTLLARTQVILLSDADTEVRLFVRGSFARYLAGFLLDAMEEYQVAV